MFQFKQYLFDIVLIFTAVYSTNCDYLFNSADLKNLSQFIGFKNVTTHTGLLVDDPLSSTQKAITFKGRVTTNNFDIYSPPMLSASGCYTISLDYYGKTSATTAAFIGISYENYTTFWPVFASPAMFNTYKGNSVVNTYLIQSLIDTNSWQTLSALVCISKTIKIRVGVSDGYNAGYPFGNFYIKNLMVSDEGGQPLYSVVEEQQEKLSYYSTQNITLMDSIYMKTWSTTMRTTNCNNFQIFPGPDNIMSVEHNNLNPAEVKLTFQNLKPNSQKMLSFEVNFVGTWSNNQFYVFIDDQKVFIAQLSDTFFEQSTNCGNKQPVGVKKFVINLPMYNTATQFVVKFQTNLNQGDYTSSFGIRNITLFSKLCTPMCQACTGPEVQNCSKCVANTYTQNFQQCQCLIGFTTQPTNKYVCDPMTTSNSSNSTSTCHFLNAQYSDLLQFNYYCAYNNVKQTHDLAVTFIPKYLQLDQCFGFKMLAVNPNDDTKQIEIGPLTKNLTQTDSDTILIAIPTDNLTNLNCIKSENDQFIIYDCKIILQFLQDGNIDVMELFFLWQVQVNKQIAKTSSLISDKKLLGTHYCMNQNNPIKCIEQIYPNSSVIQYLNYSSSDQILSNQLTANNITVDIYTKIYAQIQLTESKIASQYYPIVKSIYIQCQNPANQDDQVPFQTMYSKLGSTVVSYKIAVKGYCQVTYQIQITQTLPQQISNQRLLRRTLFNDSNHTILQNVVDYKFQTFQLNKKIKEGRLLQATGVDVFNTTSMSNDTLTNNGNSTMNQTNSLTSTGNITTIQKIESSSNYNSSSNQNITNSTDNQNTYFKEFVEQYGSMIEARANDMIQVQDGISVQAKFQSNLKSHSLVYFIIMVFIILITIF